MVVPPTSESSSPRTPDILKDCSAFKTPGTTCPMTQCHNSEDLHLQHYSDFSVLKCFMAMLSNNITLNMFFIYAYTFH
jgi:hypothetical protein